MTSPEPAVVVMRSESAEQTFELGRRLAGVVRAGDIVIVAGDLGAGKTTLTRGVGAGLGVQGPVTSPTFVLARVHRAGRRGLGLVHVDAYRLGGEAELDDLDVDAFTDSAVTVVEWGDGVADSLSADRLRLHLARDLDDQNEDCRVVTLTATGGRWNGVPLAALLSPRAEAPVDAGQ